MHTPLQYLRNSAAGVMAMHAPTVLAVEQDGYRLYLQFRHDGAVHTAELTR